MPKRDCTVPSHIFPVMSPVISLLIVCYDFRLKALSSSVCAEIDAINPLDGPKFPVNFPVNGNLFQRRVSS
jgi:hypothetical protein